MTDFTCCRSANSRRWRFAKALLQSVIPDLVSEQSERRVSGIHAGTWKEEVAAQDAPLPLDISLRAFGNTFQRLGRNATRALLRRRMVDRQLDLDPLAVAADLQFDAAGAGDAAAGGDRAGDAAAAVVEQFDVVRAEVERRLAVGAGRRRTARSAGRRSRPGRPRP